MIIIYNRNFLKDLEKLKDLKIKEALKEKILELKEANDLKKIKGVKKISGHPNAFRIRIGKFRIGFYFSNDEICLQRFVKRNDIYKLFP